MLSSLRDNIGYHIKDKTNLTRKNCFRYLKLNVAICTTTYLERQNYVMARTRKYYLKNNYLTLRSKAKVPRRPLRYVTHRLMVMHPHTK